MPTPAIDFNTHENYTAQGQTFNRLGQPAGTFDCDVNSRSWAKSRPASISTKPERKGVPREVTPWRHSWGYVQSSLNAISFRAKDPNGLFDKTYDYPQGGLWYRPTYFSTILPVPNSVINRAIINMLKKLQDQNVDFGVFFAEGREAIETVTSTANRIAKEVMAFRKKDPRSWAAVLRADDHRRRRGTLRTRTNEMPSQWLALQYGWKPLMQDCQGALSAVDHTWSKTGGIVRVKGLASTTSSDSVQVTPQGPVTLGQSLLVDRFWKLTCRMYAYYRMRNPKLAALSTLGLINPALIVWEKIPYSFVVDWFMPVGDWLNSLTAAAGYDFITGCQSTRSVVTSISTTWDPWLVSNYYYVSGDPANAYSSYKLGRMDRVVLTSSPVPGLYVKSPLSTVHLANALALLRNAFRR